MSTSKWHQRWPGKALQRKNIVLKKKMRNYRCSLYWFEHLVVSRFIHPSVILSFVSLIYRGLSPVYKWGNLNLWKLKQLKILYQTFWFKHRKKQVIKINSQWVETLHIYNIQFKNMIAILNISNWDFNVMFVYNLFTIYCKWSSPDDLTLLIFFSTITDMICFHFKTNVFTYHDS